MKSELTEALKLGVTIGPTLALATLLTYTQLIQIAASFKSAKGSSRRVRLTQTLKGLEMGHKIQVKIDGKWYTWNCIGDYERAKLNASAYFKGMTNIKGVRIRRLWATIWLNGVDLLGD